MHYTIEFVSRTVYNGSMNIECTFNLTKVNGTTPFFEGKINIIYLSIQFDSSFWLFHIILYNTNSHSINMRRWMDTFDHIRGDNGTYNEDNKHNSNDHDYGVNVCRSLGNYCIYIMHIYL